MVKTMEWQHNALEILDQTKLPVEISFIKCGTYRRVGEAIKKLEVRGAPAIGSAAGFAMVLGWQQLIAEKPLQFACLRRNKKMNLLRHALRQ